MSTYLFVDISMLILNMPSLHFQVKQLTLQVILCCSELGLLNKEKKDEKYGITHSQKKENVKKV